MVRHLGYFPLMDQQDQRHFRDWLWAKYCWLAREFRCEVWGQAIEVGERRPAFRAGLVGQLAVPD